MSERLKLHPLRLNVLTSDETANLVDSNRLIPDNTDPKAIQIQRMIDIFAGNVGSILITYPSANKRLIANATVTIAPARQDESELANILGPGISSLFAIDQPTISSPVTIRPDTQLLAVDGRLLFYYDTLDKESYATEVLLPALEKATNLTTTQILEIAELISSKRKEKTLSSETEINPTIITPPLQTPVELLSQVNDVANEVVDKMEETIEAAPSLYPHQIEMLEDISTAISAGQTEIGIYSATGTGKTRVIGEAALAIGGKTLVVVPTKIVLEKTVSELQRLGIQTGTYYGDRKTKFGNNTETEVIVTTYSSLVEESFPFTVEDITTIVFDEAHLTLGPQIYARYEDFAGVIRLGFTASPDYSDVKTIRQMFPKVFERGAPEFASTGYLSKFRVWLAKTKMDISSVSISDITGDYSERQLVIAAENAGLIESAIQLYNENFTQEKAVVYCIGINHARHTAEQFTKAGIPAAYISGETPIEQRDEILAQFRSGTIRVLCNADILTFGYDEPSASVCFNLRPTYSLVTAIQRGGRVLRLDPNNDQKIATIIDFLPQTADLMRYPITYAAAIGTAYGYPINEMQEVIEKDRDIPSDMIHPSFTLTDGTVVVTNVEEIMSIILNKALYEEPQPGEMNLRQLVELLNTAHGTLIKRLPYLLATFRKEHKDTPEINATVIRHAAHRGPTTFYTPEFIAYLQERLKKGDHEEKSLSELAEKYGLSLGTIAFKIKQYEGEHTGEVTFIEKVSIGGRMIKFYTKEVETYLDSQYSVRILADDSQDQSISDIANELNVDYSQVRDAFINIFSPDYLKYAFRARKSKGRVKVVFPADMTIRVKEIIKGELANFPIINPEDALTINQIAQKFGVSPDAIAHALIRRYGKDYANLAITGRRRGGGNQFFKMDIVEQVGNALIQKIPKDDPRKNIAELAKQLGVYPDIIARSLARLFGEKYAERGKLGQREGVRTTSLFFDQAIQQQVIEDLKPLPVDSPLKNISEMAAALGVTSNTVIRTMRKIFGNDYANLGKVTRREGIINFSPYYDENIFNQVKNALSI